MKTQPIHSSDFKVVLRQANEILQSLAGRAELAPPTHLLEDAVRHAIALRALERGAARTGFLALPLDLYLRRVAQVAGVGLHELLNPARGTHFSSQLEPWIGLASRLHLRSEYVRLWVRAWFAREFGEFSQAEAEGALVRARGMGANASQRNCADGSPIAENLSANVASQELDRAESCYSASERQALDSILGEFL